MVGFKRAKAIESFGKMSFEGGFAESWQDGSKIFLWWYGEIASPHILYRKRWDSKMLPSVGRVAGVTARMAQPSCPMPFNLPPQAVASACSAPIPSLVAPRAMLSAGLCSRLWRPVPAWTAPISSTQASTALHTAVPIRTHPMTVMHRPAVPSTVQRWGSLLQQLPGARFSTRRKRSTGVIPYMSVNGARKALAFYRQAFGAEVVDQTLTQDKHKVLHAEIKIDDAIVYISDTFPEWQHPDDAKTLGGCGIHLHVHTEDCDDAWDRAVAAGATPRQNPTDTFWGDRYGSVFDPFGYVWAFSSELSPERAASVRKKLKEMQAKDAKQAAAKDSKQTYSPSSSTVAASGQDDDSGGGLRKELYRSGDGQTFPKAGQRVTVHYTGKLLDGTTFDSSRSRGKPFTFVIGKGQVIRGWDEGVLSMSLGERCQLICPPEYAYGDQAVGGVIPANSTLLFDVELLDLK